MANLKRSKITPTELFAKSFLVYFGERDASGDLKGVDDAIDGPTTRYVAMGKLNPENRSKW